jgi:hypothetical protein
MRIALSGQIRRVFIDDLRRAAVVEQDGSSLKQGWICGFLSEASGRDSQLPLSL